MKYTLTIIFILEGIAIFGQIRTIPCKNDTLSIDQSDSVYYQTGDEISGELKYGRWGYFSVIKIDSGYISNSKHFYPTGVLQREYNYKTEIFKVFIGNGMKMKC